MLLIEYRDKVPVPVGNYAFGGNTNLFPCSYLEIVKMPNSVTSVGKGVFYFCDNLTSVTLSNNLQNIENSMFAICRSLKSITIPGDVTEIGLTAFKGSGLTSISIPDSVVSIGDAAFSYCSYLEDVTLPDNEYFTCISKDLFSEDYNLKTTNISSLSHVTAIGSSTFFNTAVESIIVPDSVTNIGDCAFQGCKPLESVTLPTNVGFTGIPDYAFQGCTKLTSIAIPASVTSIGEGVFGECSALNAINVDPASAQFSSLEGVLFNADKTHLICHPAARSGSFDIPASVTSIGDSTFYNCASLSEITLPESIRSIGNYAFSNCEDLTEIIIPQNVISIGDGTFESCYKLKEITIPEDVESIGNYAFGFCTSLTKAFILNDSTAFGSNVFVITAISSGGIYGFDGSNAQAYAQAQKPVIPFHLLYTVSFSTGEGSAVSDIVAVSEGTITAPSNPTCSGYNFSGWYKDVECTDDWDFDTDTVTGNITLYAKWSVTVNIRSISGVTAPVKGTVPVTAIIPMEQYTGTITWDPEDNPFEPSTTYTATIALMPIEGYILTGVAENFFAVADATAVSNPADSGVITAMFPATEAIKSTVMSPTTVIFDLDDPGNAITTIVDWGSATTVIGVVYGSDSLVLSEDFTIDGNTLTITEEYLYGLNLPEGDTVELVISFDMGDSAAITIEARRNPVYGTDASLSDLTVGGNSVSGFAAGKYEYAVELPYGTLPGSVAAAVGAVSNDPSATVSITQASALPGSAAVKVVAEDGITEQSYTVVFTLESALNTVPARKSGIPATESVDVTVNTAYTLNLSNIFEDADSNPLTYKVLINGMTAVGANVNYSYTPAATGITTLEFRANDGTADSTDTYKVTLTANYVPVYTLTITAEIML